MTAGMVINPNLTPPSLALDTPEAASSFLTEYNKYQLKGGRTPVFRCLDQSLHLLLYWKAQRKGMLRKNESLNEFLSRQDILDCLRQLYATDNVASSADITLITCGKYSERFSDPNPFPTFIQALMSRLHTNRDPPRLVAKQLVDGVKTNHTYLYNKLKPIFTSFTGENGLKLLCELHRIADEHFQSLENSKRILNLQHKSDKTSSRSSNSNSQQSNKRSATDSDKAQETSSGGHRFKHRQNSSGDSTNAGNNRAPAETKKEPFRSQSEAQKPKPSQSETTRKN